MLDYKKSQQPRENLSESEEMYLVSVASLVESSGNVIVPISQLAEALSIHVVSTNQMIRKLQEEGLVDYLPYKGVLLTPLGESVARQMIRSRRLWEVFLVQHLNLAAERAAELACGMEHLTDGELSAQLDAFLDHPQYDPFGRLIPDGDEHWLPDSLQSLSEAQVGEQWLIGQLKGDAATRAYLASEGIYPGARVTILAVSASGAMLLGIEEQTIQMSARVVEQILASKIPQDVNP